MRRSLLLFILKIFPLLEVHCQTAPYVSFMSQTLANHSYVDLSLVGDSSSGSDSVQCHTDLESCCSGMQGVHRGDWNFPNGDRLQFAGDGSIFEQRVAQRVDLRRRNSATSPVGIYHCNISVDDDDGENPVRVVYVGLYAGSGGELKFQSLADKLISYVGLSL